MDSHELEQLRRSIAMGPPGHSAGALSREQGPCLVEEAADNRQDAARYRLLVAQLRALVDPAGDG